MDGNHHGRKKNLEVGIWCPYNCGIAVFICMYIYIYYVYIYIYTMCIYIYTHRHSISMHLICTYNWNCSPLKGQQDSRKAQHSDFAWHVHGPASSPFFIIWGFWDAGSSNMKERKPMFFHVRTIGTGHFPAGKCPEKSCISTKKLLVIQSLR